MLKRIKNAIWAFRQSPNISISDLDRIIDGFDFGDESESGVRVSESTGTRHATVYSCINILARDMSALPLKLYERQANGGRAIVESHPVSEWLRQPNRSQTPMQWRQRGWYSTLATGNQYEQILISRRGDIETLPLDSSRVRVKVNARTYEKAYEYTLRDGQTVTLSDDQVFHSYGLSIDGFCGISPIRHCMETIGQAIAVDEYGAAYFRSPIPKVIMEWTTQQGFASPADRDTFRREWGEQFAGKRGLKSVALPPPGMKFGQVVKIANEEAQFIETRKMSKEQIAMIYGVPMHRLQALDRATFSNIEHQDLEYSKYALAPWLVALEQSIERRFLAGETDRFFVKHNLDALLRGDFKTRMEGYATAISAGKLTPNEGRALEDRPSLPGGDDLLIQMNMIPLKDLAASQQAAAAPEPPPPDAEEDDEDDERQIVLNRAAGMGEMELRAAQARRAVIRRMIPRLLVPIAAEVKVVAAAVRDSGIPLLRSESRDATTFWAWLDEFTQSRIVPLRRSVAPVYAELARQIADMAAAEVGVEAPEERIERYAGRAASNFAQIWADETVSDLKDAAVDAETAGADPAESVERRLEQWEEGTTGKNRAEQVAEHESFLVGNGVARTVFVAFGLRLVWATFGQNCPYCSAMRGKRVGPGQDFVESGDLNPAGAKRPLRIRRGVRQPPLHGGCDCMVIPGI